MISRHSFVRNRDGDITDTAPALHPPFTVLTGDGAECVSPGVVMGSLIT